MFVPRLDYPRPSLAGLAGRARGPYLIGRTLGRVPGRLGDDSDLVNLPSDTDEDLVMPDLSDDTSDIDTSNLVNLPSLAIQNAVMPSPQLNTPSALQTGINALTSLVPGTAAYNAAHAPTTTAVPKPPGSNVAGTFNLSSGTITAAMAVAAVVVVLVSVGGEEETVIVLFLVLLALTIFLVAAVITVFWPMFLYGARQRLQSALTDAARQAIAKCAGREVAE